jgi:hypothetical protein
VLSRQTLLTNALVVHVESSTRLHVELDRQDVCLIIVMCCVEGASVVDGGGVGKAVVVVVVTSWPTRIAVAAVFAT